MDSAPKKRGCPAISTRSASELRHNDHLSPSFAFYQPTGHVRMLKACLPPSPRALFSYILVYESVLPSPGVTRITGIARTAIALPTRLLDGQITRELGCRHKPMLNGLGTNSPYPLTVQPTICNELDLRKGASSRRTSSNPSIYRLLIKCLLSSTPLAIIEIDLFLADDTAVPF